MKLRKIKRIKEEYTVPAYWQERQSGLYDYRQEYTGTRIFYTIDGSKKQFWTRDDARKYAKKMKWKVK